MGGPDPIEQSSFDVEAYIATIRRDETEEGNAHTQRSRLALTSKQIDLIQFNRLQALEKRKVHKGASGAPHSSRDEQVCARSKPKPYHSETLYTDTSSESERMQTKTQAAESTMESHSDTLDESLYPCLSPWGDTRPCHGGCGVAREGSNSSSSSKQQNDKDAEDRAAKKPKLAEAQEVKGSESEKEAPISLQNNLQNK